jgi:hypothetical protein
VKLSENFIDFAKRWIGDKKNKNQMNMVLDRNGQYDSQNSPSLTEFLSELYIKTYSIRIIRENTVDGDNSILSSNLVQIMDRDYNILEINPNEKFYVNRNIKCAYYNNHYYNLCVSEMNTLDVNFFNEDSNDTFYIQHVDIQVVSDIIHYVSLLDPLLDVIKSNTFTINQISEGEVALKRLSNLIRTGGRNKKKEQEAIGEEFSK